LEYWFDSYIYCSLGFRYLYVIFIPGKIKIMKDMETSYRAITNADGNIELSDLYKDNGSFYCEPSLHFKGVLTEGFWDNVAWIKKLFKDLKARKKSEQVKDLKQFCKENNLVFKEIKSELRSIYKTSVHLNFWEK